MVGAYFKVSQNSLRETRENLEKLWLGQLLFVPIFEPSNFRYDAGLPCATTQHSRGS
jgi:hypothetical protein